MRMKKTQTGNRAKFSLIILLNLLLGSFIWTDALPAGPNPNGPGIQKKISPDLEERLNAATGKIRVIIRTRGLATPGDLADLQGRGGKILRKFSRFPGVAVEIPAQAIRSLELNPRVESISPDRSVWINLDVSTPTAWNGTLGSNIGGYGPTGKDVVIAVLDTGIFEHRDLQGEHKSRVLQHIPIALPARTKMVLQSLASFPGAPGGASTGFRD